MKKLVIILFALLSNLVQAQNSLPNVTLDVEEQPFLLCLADLEQQTGYRFFYRSEWMDSLTLTMQADDWLLDQVLDKMVEVTDLYILIHDQQVFITKDIKLITEPRIAEEFKEVEDSSQANVEKGLVFTREYLEPEISGLDAVQQVITIGSRKQMISGRQASIAGYLKNDETGEALAGVLVYTQDPMISVLSDESGFYSITLPVGSHQLNYQFFGMQPAKRNIVLFSNGQLNVDMSVDVMSLDEVVIESDREANTESVEMGVSKISVTESKNVPVLLGELDVMKVATTMAGIQTVGEGASGFNVRGGKADQNLITLDHFPIYNTSHFFGFFSVFNSEAVDDMSIYKSSIPAKYGGRLSSVMDIKSKQANRDSISGSGGVSPITSKLVLETPLFNKKAGLIMAGRATYSNYILKIIDNSDFSQNKVSFMDGMVRYDHDLGKNDKLTLSTYYSKDNFRMDSDTLFSFSDFQYENLGGSLEYIHHFSDGLSTSLIATYSSYQYELSYNASPPNAYQQDFGIEEKGLKNEWEYTAMSDHEWLAGFEVKSIQVNPGTKSPFGEESMVEKLRTRQELALESAIFLSDQYTVGERLSIYAGLRYSLFHRLGPGTVQKYQPNNPKNDEAMADSVSYNSGEVMKMYGGLEPRMSARWKLDQLSSLKVGYNRTRQYVHSLSNSASVSPTDIWRLSGRYLSPQISDQFSVGYYRNFLFNSIEASAEVYYKDIQNLLDFKVGSSFLLHPNVETVVLQGRGRSYGLELSVKKSGKLSGWINYTYARTMIKLDGAYPEERINGGSYYTTNYDIPHTLNLVANYKITHRVSVSYNFTYKSGRPITYPAGVYDFHGSLSVHYSDRNSFRIPHYMRMDVGLNLETGHKLGKLAYSYWSFSVYNLLGRDNPYSVFFSVDDDEIKGHKLVVFGTPIPTITFNFVF